ncbi:cellulose biosynthesis protein BcsN, partial [Ochrobactrum sp. SFR4]|uniref:cellulose biosynthesis protein BcsN n=1 Tax=Ochrobactrum sp. SFR4 TaxID=2717368 RepID=UPI001C8BD2C2
MASCATKDPSSLAYGKREIGIDNAFVLPADRSVVGITQERASNAITQTIALNTNSALSGENFFRVTFY